MALLKKKVEEVSVEETSVENTEESNDKVLTPSEDEVVSTGASEVSVANSKKLELAMELLAHRFNIDGTFYLTKAQDKGNKMTLGFSNMDYNVTIEIKNVEEMGLDSLD